MGRLVAGAAALLVLSAGTAAATTDAAATGTQAKATVGATTKDVSANITQLKKCLGYRVRRCLWINVDHYHNRVRVYGEASEGPGGAIYDVAVEHVITDNMTGFRPYAGDLDGYHARADGAWSRLESCVNGRYYEFNLRGNFGWRNSQTGNYDSEVEDIDVRFRC
ncbi:hypothetical protein [Jiangella gansuensis]|uniref:hypothetical protein n=1 Tax=Jiangella gansuensis TaxID=281473 RepID=UPI0012FBF50A|nr:hypothetical protein [Jiangella gansuensis]